MSNFEVLESFILLRRSVALMRAAEIKSLDFGHNQISVLYRLSLSNATMGELAEHALSDKASMTRTVSTLEAEGYIKRTPDKNDRRIMNIELTAKGRVYAKKAQEVRKTIGKTLDQTLSASERKQFSHLVQKITSEFNTKKHRA